MLKRRASVLLTLVVLLASVISGCDMGGPMAGPTMTPPPQIEAEEYAVFSAMIRQNPIGYNLGSSILVREQTLPAIDDLESSLENGASLPARLVESFRSRNEARYMVQANLDVGLDYGLMPEEAFERIFRRSGQVWTRFEEEYPQADGLVSFSRVGFGAKGDEALVLMGFRCGDLCGAGGLYLLVKEQGDWKVQKSLMVWQS